MDILLGFSVKENLHFGSHLYLRDPKASRRSVI